MKILLVHGYYQLRGGEDAVVSAEYEMLREKGHDVDLYTRHNDEIAAIPSISAGSQAFWSRRTTADVSALIQRRRPDVVHVHNTFPLISPSLYWAIHRAGLPLVQTLHNYRLFCPQGTFLRDGKVCMDCLSRAPVSAIVHKCYRGSVAQTAVLAGMLMVHRGLGTWRDKVTRYIALSEFSRAKFVEGGLPAEKIVVKANFVTIPAHAPSERSGFLFVGRLSKEKGIATLAAALRNGAEYDLRIAGVGPEAALLDDIPGVTRFGALDSQSVYAQMRQARALVIPSVCHEHFPRSLVEAYACGLPVIASRLGALAELVEDGVTGILFEPGDAADLSRKLAWAQDNAEALASMGLRARSTYEQKYTSDVNYRRLIDVYGEAINSVAG